VSAQVALLVSLAIAAFAAFVAIAYRRAWSWAGFTESADRRSGKTLWDWMELLLIPLALTLGVFVLNAAQSNRDQRRDDERISRDRAIALDRTREEALSTHLREMGDLLLDRQLTSSQAEGPLRSVARSKTLSVLRRLDPVRKAAVVSFLADSGLIARRRPVVSLVGADLRRMRFSETLVDTNLGGARLEGADFSSSKLEYVKFGRTVGSTFSFLPGGRQSSFEAANLHRATFRDADLVSVSFAYSDLRSATFDRGHIYWSSFRGSCLTNARFRRAVFLEGNLSAKGVHPDFSDAVLLKVDLSFHRLFAPRLDRVRYDTDSPVDDDGRLPQYRLRGIEDRRTGTCFGVLPNRR
jgi:hypothetical protein